MNRRAISDNKQRSAHEEHKMPFYPEKGRRIDRFENQGGTRRD